MSPEVPDPWRLSTPSELVRRMRDWVDQAKVRRFGDSFVNVLADIQHSLTTIPHEWGDPVHRLRGMRLLMCHRIYRLLHVSYAIHDEARIVFIKNIIPLRNHPLIDES